MIAKLGLDLLSQGPHKVGLRALLDVAGLTGKPIDGGHVVVSDRAARERGGTDGQPGHRRAPAAGGRRDDGGRGAGSGEPAERRKHRGARPKRPGFSAQAKKLVETDPAVGARSIIVVGGEGWHRGVIGIVASKLVDAFHRPAIVLSIDGDLAHGSCRSIRHFDILGALERCAGSPHQVRRTQAGRRSDDGVGAMWRRFGSRSPITRTIAWGRMI